MTGFNVGGRSGVAAAVGILLVAAVVAVTSPAAAQIGGGLFRIELDFDDPVAIALAFSRTAFQQSDEALLATTASFADAVASAALQRDASPLLLTDPDRLDDRVVDELRRLGADDVVILGGTTAISEDVEATLEQEGFDTSRVAGTSRLETSLAISREAGSLDGVLVLRAFGSEANPTAAFADALAAGAWAAANDYGVLLTESTRLSDPARQGLERYDHLPAFIVGGTAAISDEVEQTIRSIHPDVTRVAGTDRISTAIAIQQAADSPTGNVLLLDAADGNAWVAGFTASSFAAVTQTSVLLTNGDQLADATRDWLDVHRPTTIVCGPGITLPTCSDAGGGADPQPLGAGPTPTPLTRDHRVDSANICNSVYDAVPLDGALYPASMAFSHCNSDGAEVTFDIGRDYTRLVATIGPWDLADEGASYRWEVYLDGTFAEQLTTGIGDPAEVDLDVTGVQRVRFVAYADDGPYARVALGSPRLYTADTVDVYPAPDPLTPTVDTVFLDERERVQSGGICSSAAGAYSIGGQTFPRSRVARVCFDSGFEVYEIGRDFERFRTTVGIEDIERDDSFATVRIVGDGQLLATVQTAIGQTAPVDVDVTGVLRLRLEVDVSGQGTINVVWGTARLVVPDGADNAPPPVD